MVDREGPLPADFAESLGLLVEPGEEAGVAQVLGEATRLADPLLAAFLEALAIRISSDPAPIRAAELRAILAGGERA
jgi:hypothetical protein